jgi:hypothetical protein
MDEIYINVDLNGILSFVDWCNIPEYLNLHQNFGEDLQ